LVVAPVRRRELLSISGAAGASLLVAGCGSSVRKVSQLPGSVRAADVDLLNGVLDVEHLVVTAYTAAVPLLSHHNLRAAQHFLDQETSHVNDLDKLIRSAGGSPHGERPRYDLGQPRGEAELLELLRHVEGRAVSAYLEAIPRLVSAEARQTAISILAVEAQHLSIIRRNLGLSPVPSPLVTGAQ
jgi:rubrerythrin